MTKKRAGSAAKNETSEQPVAPRIDESLREPPLAELLDDDQWTRSAISHDLSGAQLRRLDVAECRFIGCRLTGADLQGARLVDVEFVDCEMSGISWVDAVLTRVALRNCRLSGALLTSAKLRDVTIIECKADELGMRMSVIERATFEHTLLRDADFYSAHLELCRIFDCDLTGVQFSKATFVETRLHGSSLGGVRGIETVRGVVIDPDQVHDFTAALLAAHDITVESARERTQPSPGGGTRQT